MLFRGWVCGITGEIYEDPWYGTRERLEEDIRKANARGVKAWIVEVIQTTI